MTYKVETVDGNLINLKENATSDNCAVCGLALDLTDMGEPQEMSPGVTVHGGEPSLQSLGRIDVKAVDPMEWAYQLCAKVYVERQDSFMDMVKQALDRRGGTQERMGEFVRLFETYYAQPMSERATLTDYMKQALAQPELVEEESHVTTWTSEGEEAEEGPAKLRPALGTIP